MGDDDLNTGDGDSGSPPDAVSSGGADANPDSTPTAAGAPASADAGSGDSSAPADDGLARVDAHIEVAGGDDVQQNPYSLQVPTNATLTLVWTSTHCAKIILAGFSPLAPSGSMEISTVDQSWMLTPVTDAGFPGMMTRIDVHTHAPGDCVSPHAVISSGVAKIISFAATLDGAQVTSAKVGDTVAFTAMISDGADGVTINGSNCNLSPDGTGGLCASLNVTIADGQTSFTCVALRGGSSADENTISIAIDAGDGADTTPADGGDAAPADGSGAAPADGSGDAPPGDGSGDASGDGEHKEDGDGEEKKEGGDDEEKKDEDDGAPMSFKFDVGHWPSAEVEIVKAKYYSVRCSLAVSCELTLKWSGTNKDPEPAKSAVQAVFDTFPALALDANLSNLSLSHLEFGASDFTLISSGEEYEVASIKLASGDILIPAFTGHGSQKSEAFAVECAVFSFNPEKKEMAGMPLTVSFGVELAKSEIELPDGFSLEGSFGLEAKCTGGIDIAGIVESNLLEGVAESMTEDMLATSAEEAVSSASAVILPLAFLAATAYAIWKLSKELDELTSLNDGAALSQATAEFVQGYSAGVGGFSNSGGSEWAAKGCEQGTAFLNQTLTAWMSSGDGAKYKQQDIDKNGGGGAEQADWDARAIMKSKIQGQAEALSQKAGAAAQPAISQGLFQRWAEKESNEALTCKGTFQNMLGNVNYWDLTKEVRKVVDANPDWLTSEQRDQKERPPAKKGDGGE